ncbi:MAG: hypothetical protein IPI01_00160 [Ignavibacteriae bacterium]|nr:hypothetical protein [Ignavibacteriota bacterium]
MQAIVRRAATFFGVVLDVRSRVVVIIAALALLLTYFLPLWSLTLYSNQFPEGLVLKIHGHKLEGDKSPSRDDLKEINALNHYIGMRALREEDFTEFRWIPFVIGGLILLGLRVAVMGRMDQLVDLLVLFVYFGGFSLWSFYRKLYLYGHELDPTAAVKVPPFMPPLFGHQTLANFEVYSYPEPGSVVMVFSMLMLGLALVLALRAARKKEME